MYALSNKTSFPKGKNNNNKNSCFLFSYKALLMNRSFDSKYAFFEMWKFHHYCFFRHFLSAHYDEEESETTVSNTQISTATSWIPCTPKVKCKERLTKWPTLWNQELLPESEVSFKRQIFFGANCKKAAKEEAIQDTNMCKGTVKPECRNDSCGALRNLRTLRTSAVKSWQVPLQAWVIPMARGPS